MKIKKRNIVVLLAMILVASTGIESVASAASCYTNYYRSRPCSSCDDSSFNEELTDSCSAKHPRQYGIKLCSSCRNGMSTQATYYKRGYSDYNCLAYALGYNGVQSWEWPTSWGTGPTESQFIVYIKNKGYSYTLNENNATGTNVIYVYGVNGYVKHFSRGYTLDGKKVSGAATISKWGPGSLYTTSTTYPYTAASGYGNLVMTCYK